MKKAIIFLLAAGIISCQPDMFDLAVFDAERGAWQALRISSYRFTAQSFPDYPLTIPFTVTVRPNTEPEITYSEWNQERRERMEKSSPGKIFPPLSGVTIGELYTSMRKLAISSSSWDSIIQIRYNKEYHYPEEFVNRPSQKDLIGVGYSFKITQFEVLE